MLNFPELITPVTPAQRMEPLGGTSPARLVIGPLALTLAQGSGPATRSTRALYLEDVADLPALAPLLAAVGFKAHQIILQIRASEAADILPLVFGLANSYTKLLVLTDTLSLANLAPHRTFARCPMGSAPDREMDATSRCPMTLHYLSASHHGPVPPLTDDLERAARADRGAKLPLTWAYHSHPFQEADRQWRAALKELDSRRQSGAQAPEKMDATSRCVFGLTPAGLIDNCLTEFDRLNTTIDELHKNIALKLAHHSPYDLVIRRQTRGLLHYLLGQTEPRTPWTITSELRAVLEDALANCAKARASIYPLPPTQRLGYIDEIDSILCTKSLPPFVAGQTYPVTVLNVQVTRERHRPNLSGVQEQVEYTANESMIVLASSPSPLGGERAGVRGERDATSPLASAARTYRFVDSRVITKDTRFPYIPNLSDTPYTLQHLVTHFDIPAVPDVAAIHPEAHAAHVARLAEIERDILGPRGIRLKDFQREDLPRAACLDGLILAWDTGLGKTWAMFLWSLLKLGWTAKDGVQGSALLVAPGDLHEQIIAEGRNRFGLDVRLLPDQAGFHKLVRGYSADGRPLIEPGFYLTTYTALALNGTKLPADLPEPFRPADPPEHITHGIPCICNPSLAHLAAHAFDAVLVDEGVRIKSHDTHVGKAMAVLQPRYRLVLTATPIKNRLLDIFRLLWWAAGGKASAHPRFPYGPGETERKRLGDAHLVTESTLGPRPRKKTTAEVCNIQALYKLLAPNILRRRKSDILGTDQIVPKIRQVVRVPLGALQARVYEHHLHGLYTDRHDQPAIVAKLSALRLAACAPHSELLRAVPPENGARPQPHRSGLPYIPKIHAALQLILQALRKGEQIVVFSAFTDPLDNLLSWLSLAGVPSEIIDGRHTPKQRARISARFQSGPLGRLPVLAAGVESAAEGHNWWLCNNAALLSFSWAADKFEQAINRIHRLPSPVPVNVFPIVASGSIDLRLEHLLDEKSRASDLVLDGRLMGEATDEITLWDLLRGSSADFTAVDATDELALLQRWPQLRDELTRAAIQWPRLAEQRAQTLVKN